MIFLLIYMIASTYGYCTSNVTYNNDIPLYCNDIDSYYFCHNATVTYRQYATILKNTLISKLNNQDYNIFAETVNYALPNRENYCTGFALCEITDMNDTCINTIMYNQCLTLNSSFNSYNYLIITPFSLKNGTLIYLFLFIKSLACVNKYL